MIFDLDGTLTDSAEGIVASFRHALAEIGAEVPDGDLAGRIVGPPMHTTLAALGLGDRVDEAVAAYRADYTSRGWAMNTVFDGVTELLTDLRDAGVRLAVATSKAEPTARRILEHFEMAAHFEVIAGASHAAVSLRIAAANACLIALAWFMAPVAPVAALALGCGVVFALFLALRPAPVGSMAGRA